MSLETNLVEILRSAFKEFRKELRKSGDASAQFQIIDTHAQAISCCMNGLVLAAARNPNSEEEALVRDLQKYLGSLSDVPAIISKKKKIRSALKNLAKLKANQTLHDEVVKANETVLESFNQYKDAFFVVPSLSTTTPRTARTTAMQDAFKSAQETFDEMFTRFKSFVCDLCKLLSKHKPKDLSDLCKSVESLESLAYCVYANKTLSYIRGNISEATADVIKKFTSVFDDFVKIIASDEFTTDSSSSARSETPKYEPVHNSVSDSEDDDDDDEEEEEEEKEKEAEDNDNNGGDLADDPSATVVVSCPSEHLQIPVKTLSASTSDDDDDNDDNNNNLDDKGENLKHSKDDKNDRNNDNSSNESIEELVRKTAEDSSVLDGINDLDTLKKLVLAQARKIKKLESPKMSAGAYNGGNDDDNEDENADNDSCHGSMVAEDNDTNVFAPGPSSQLIADNNNMKPVHRFNTDIQNSKRREAPGSIHVGGLSSSSSILHIKGKQMRVSHSNITLSRLNLPMLERTKMRSNNDSGIVAPESGEFTPRPVKPIIDMSKQEAGLEFICGSLYAYLVGQMLSNPKKTEGEQQHLNLISMFYELAKHVLIGAFHATSILSNRCYLRGPEYEDKVRISALETQEMTVSLLKEVRNECVSSTHQGFPEKISVKITAMIEEIASKKIFEQKPVDPSRTGKPRYTQEAKDRITEMHKTEIAQYASRLCDIITSLARPIYDITSSSKPEPTDIIFEAFAWCKSLLDFVKKVTVAYDAVILLENEPTKQCIAPFFNTSITSAGVIAILRNQADIDTYSCPSLYDELDKKRELLGASFYSSSYTGKEQLPTSISLNEIVTLATDPISTSEAIRIKLTDLFVHASPLVFQSHTAVLAALMDRFCIPDSFIRKLSSDSIGMAPKEYAATVRSKTLRLLERWVEEQCSDIDDVQLRALDYFISNEVVPFSRSAASKLRASVQEHKESLQKTESLAALPSTKSFVYNSNIYTFINTFQKYSNETIAGQMTLASANLFRAIKFKELCYAIISKERYHYACPNYIRFEEHQNGITHAMVLYVFAKATPDERKAAWEKVLDVMGCIDKKNNFTDIAAIQCAYDTFFDTLCPGQKPTKTKYSEVFKGLGTEKYNAVYDKAQSPKIPYITATVKVWGQMYEVSSSNDPMKLNLRLAVDVYDHIRPVWETYKRCTYKTLVNPSLYRLFYEPPKFMGLSDASKGLWKL